MSGIAVIIDFDNPVIGTEEIKKMTSAMSFRGPDGFFHRQMAGCALGYCSFCTAADPSEGTQPWLCEETGCALALDGFISNCDELTQQLLDRGRRLHSGCDAELLLHAYEIWGEDCAKYVEGEYAFFVWDPRRHTGFAAVDHAGLRPLHYFECGRRVILATDIAAILALPDLPRQLDHEILAELASDSFFTNDRTIWRGINRLPPAHGLRINGDGTRKQRYWSIPLGGDLRYSSDGEYLEHYREILRESVRRCSRSNRTIAIEASGGLDSSAIFCLAKELHESGRLQAPNFRGYSFYGEAGGPSDETAFTSILEDHVGLPLQRAPLRFPGAKWFAEEAAKSCDIPPFPNLAISLPLGEKIVRDGSRVTLNGIGGDHCQNGSLFGLQELLLEGAWAKLACELQHIATEEGWGRALKSCARYALYPNVPAKLKQLVRMQRLERELKKSDYLYWLSEGPKESIQEKARSELGERSASALESFKMDHMQNPFLGIQFSVLSNFYARRGYESRSPMFSRPYLEFCASIPQNIKIRLGTQRYIHREAMRGILPTEIVDRRTKAEFTIAYDKLIEELGPEIAEISAISLPDLFNGHGVRKLIETRVSQTATARGINLSHNHSRELWGVFAASVLGQLDITT